MALHIIKLCVGADSLEDLREWVSERAMSAIAAGLEPHTTHTTRMVPKRVDELLDGGSLYWVIKGQVQARQKLLGIETFTDVDGIHRCRLILDPSVVETASQPRRAFQGWRYLPQEDVPRDLDSLGGGVNELPADLRRELSELGLL
ncbi:DUF1489 family protein [Rhizobium sp. CB3171]|uniref:DUF1489 family protein n=1 Tax=unclassified Rhizobium TaxID=2613769 RepID=UPI000CDF3175|nr:MULTISPECIES: DUF1489 family protein [Rhizobium]AVA21663.1 hypothetical protein NXC24_CH02024 [Rhizobium sp. NXC24]MDK4737588.1 DUF1489 family protein [Rhizobium sp. CNPSo 3464]UWU22724.1 DUF1489 family protein [Rhizobium tropici]WFU03516.1 DUF1489 family protein [Rhizobium sp. CB3171]